MGGISPTDMQVMITKSVEVAKQYGQEIHKGVASQQNAAEDEARLRDEEKSLSLFFSIVYSFSLW